MGIMSKTNNTVTWGNNVNWKLLEITDLASNDRIPSQELAYARYNDNQLYIQSPEMVLDNYGIPDGDGPFYQTVKQQAHLKLPLDVNPNVENETEEERKSRGKKLSTFKQKLIELDEKLVRPDFMKCKIPLSYPDEDVVVDVYRKN